MLLMNKSNKCLIILALHQISTIRHQLLRLFQIYQRLHQCLYISRITLQKYKTITSSRRDTKQTFIWRRGKKKLAEPITDIDSS